MKDTIIKMLNWFEGTPAKYGKINNIDNFSLSFLVESGNDEPEITLKKFMEDMQAMAKCGENPEWGLTVIEGGVARE